MANSGRNTFPASARIRSKSDFDRLFREGERTSDNLLTLLAAMNGEDSARLGISAPRRFGNAVQRNRIKRLVREAFRRLRHELPPGTDWVVVPRAGGREATLEAVCGSLRRLTGRLARRITPEGHPRQNPDSAASPQPPSH